MIPQEEDIIVTVRKPETIKKRRAHVAPVNPQTYKKCEVCNMELNLKSFTRHARTHLVEKETSISVDPVVEQVENTVSKRKVDAVEETKIAASSKRKRKVDPVVEPVVRKKRSRIVKL